MIKIHILNLVLEDFVSQMKEFELILERNLCLLG